MPPKNAEDELQENRRLEHAAVNQMREIVEVTGIVTLVFEFHAVADAERVVDLLDIAKRIGEDVGVGVEQIALLPIVFPGLVAARHREQREIHRAHVHRAHFRRQRVGGGDALLDGHGHGAARGDVHHRIGRLFDARQKLHEDVGVGRRPAVLRVARVQMQDGGAGRGGIDRLRGDLIGRDRQRVRHGRRVDRAGDRAADDDFVRHGSFLPVTLAVRPAKP